MYCKKCGQEILKDSRYCSNCGNKVFEETKTHKSEKKSTILSIFILGIVSIASPFVSLGAVCGLVTGCIALNLFSKNVEVQDNEKAKTGYSLAKAGVIISSIFIAIFVSASIDYSAIWAILLFVYLIFFFLVLLI